ncbi:MAG: winged helix-turn-helix transcriptional regulator [Halanaerobiales bacterium]|nr:winged helix-turn-helix transcriptional regulator [Halanaerobiales bacterium]
MKDQEKYKSEDLQPIDVCTECKIHDDLLNSLDDELNEETYQHLAEIFKTLGDPTRIKIIHVLSQTELCVCDLAKLLQMSQSAISHQLRVLRNNRLVKYRKEGRTVFYSLDDEHILCLFNQGLSHVLHG